MIFKLGTLLCSASILLSLYANEKVLIITHSYTRPEFIAMQDRCFKAFLQDDYEFVVFNDAPNEEMQKKIEDACTSLAIRCIRVPQELHNECQAPSARHGHGIKLSLEMLGYKHNGIVFIIDSDMFLIKPLSVNEYIQNYDFVGLAQQRGNVIYSGLFIVLMKMNTLPNKQTLCFDRGWINGYECDTGAQTYNYFKNNPSVRVKYYPELYFENLSNDSEIAKTFDPVTQHFFQILKTNFDEINPHRLQLHADHFLHYVAGSNHDKKSQEYHVKKTKIVFDYIDSIIDYYQENQQKDMFYNLI